MHHIPKPKPTFVWIYHKDLPDGRMIPTQDAIANKQQLLDDGYVDTPEKLDLPKPEPKPVSANNVAEASKLSDDDFISLFLNRGMLAKLDLNLFVPILKSAGYTVHTDEPLINRFIQKPTDLTKKELKTLGKDYGLALKSSMSEQEMIDSISENLPE